MRHWFFSNPRVHLKAAWEVVFMTGCGLLAFAFIPFIRAAHRAILDPNLEIVTLYDTISRGQLFPFCFSMIGAILWLQGQEFRGKGIPARALIGLLVYGASFVCIVMYAINPKFDRELPLDFVITSALTVLVFVLIRYFLIVVRDMPVQDVQKTLQVEADAMTERARVRRGGK